MISVALSIYNGEKYLLEQMISLTNQTVIPDEIIIIDDFSKDKTIELIETFIKNINSKINFKLLKNSENLGYIKSFYRAIQNSSGDIVFLCDQDDIWALDKIEKMSKIMFDNEQILSLSSKFQKIDDSGYEISDFKIPFFSNSNLIKRYLKNESISKINLKEIVASNISPGCTTAIRPKILMKYISEKSVDYCFPHDWELNTIASVLDGLYFYNSVTTYYRIHENNTIGLKMVSDINTKVLVLKKVLKMRSDQLKISNELGLNVKNDYISNLKFLVKANLEITKKRIDYLEKGKVLDAIYGLYSQECKEASQFYSLLNDIVLLIKCR